MTVSWVPGCVLGSRGHAAQLDSLGPAGTCGPMKVADVYAPTSHQATRVRRGTEEHPELPSGGRGCCGEGFPGEMQKGKGKASARGSGRHHPNVIGSLGAQGRSRTAGSKLGALVSGEPQCLLVAFDFSASLPPACSPHSRGMNFVTSPMNHYPAHTTPIKMTKTIQIKVFAGALVPSKGGQT